MSDDLVAFLRARLDEDEAVAKAAVQVGNDRYGDLYRVQVQFDPGGMGLDDGWLTVDPTRVLREVEAKRALLDRHVAERHEDCDTLRILAAVYSDHPDYRQEWAP